jgi:calcium-dependent protein kinase
MGGSASVPSGVVVKSEVASRKEEDPVSEKEKALKLRQLLEPDNQKSPSITKPDNQQSSKFFSPRLSDASASSQKMSSPRRRSCTGDGVLPTDVPLSPSRAESAKRRRSKSLGQNVVTEIFDREISDVYDLNRTLVLGTGANGSVRVCVHKTTRIQYALKTLEKSAIRPEQLARLKEEIIIMQEIDHPNIIRLHETFENDEYIHLVMELLRGGELLDRLNSQRNNNYSERVACGYIHTILKAVRYCHDRGIVHRDLKLENFVFENESAESPLKMIDFGLGAKFSKNEKMKRAVGTPYYVAPEVLQENYDEKCDVWSIGVIAYMLLSGLPPFDGNNNDETLEAVNKGKWHFDEYAFRKVSNKAKDFVKECLIRDPRKRKSAEQMLSHEWFSRTLDLRNVPGTSTRGSFDAPTEDEPLDIVHNLVQFSEREDFIKVCMEVVAHTLQTDQVNHLREEFMRLDTGHTGVLGHEQFMEILSETLTPKRANEVFQNINFDKTGKVQYKEFLAAAINVQSVTEQNLRVAFDLISNHQETIIADDLTVLLGAEAQEGGRYNVEEMMSEVGLKKDDEIDFKKVSRFSKCRFPVNIF